MWKLGGKATERKKLFRLNIYEELSPLPPTVKHCRRILQRKKTGMNSTENSDTAIPYQLRMFFFFFCFGFIRVRAHSYTVWLVGDFWLSKWTAAVAMRKFGSNLFCVWFFDDVVRGWNLNLRETLWIYDWGNHIKMLRKLCDEYGKNNWAICNCEMKKLCLFCLCYCNEIKFDWFCLCDRLG